MNADTPHCLTSRASNQLRQRLPSPPHQDRITIPRNIPRVLVRIRRRNLLSRPGETVARQDEARFGRVGPHVLGRELMVLLSHGRLRVYRLAKYRLSSGLRLLLLDRRISRLSSDLRLLLLDRRIFRLSENLRLLDRTTLRIYRLSSDLRLLLLRLKRSGQPCQRTCLHA
jgi:hypothetical protein